MSGFKHLNEANTCDRLITPAIKKAGYKDTEIEREYKITDGKIINEDKNGKAIRSNPKFADYLLLYNDFQLAIVEAKKTTKNVYDGLSQAKLYAEKLNIPFAFSSNGREFVFYNRLTNELKELTMDEFPTKEELIDLYMTFYSFSETDRKNILNPFYSASGYTKTARYYQKIAVNKIIENVIKGYKRQLLVMATGCGKTFTAFQITHKLLALKDENGKPIIKKVLFLADRNILVDQTMSNDFNPYSKKSNKININSSEFTTAYDIYFSIYQQLSLKSKGVELMDGEEPLANLKSKFKPDYFDVIFVDECHRGVKENSAWKGILDYFSSSIQIGMTATPKITENEEELSTVDYFGEPVYTYSLKDGIEDGFLAPYRVLSIKTNVDEYGVNYNTKHYEGKSIDKSIVIDERCDVVARRVTEYLRKTDPYQRTIVFCVDQEHADRMRNALIKHNRDLVAENSEYVVRITGDDYEGKSLLDKFIDSEEKYPVIATTSKLLTTGVDCKTCKLIVLDSNIESMTTFKQIIGRGTRVEEKYGKSIFTIMDFRDVALKKFKDDNFDGIPLSVGSLDEDGSLSDIVDGMFSTEKTNSDKELEENEEKNNEEPREKIKINAYVNIVKEDVMALDGDSEDITDVIKNQIKQSFVEDFENIEEFNDYLFESMKNQKSYTEFVEKYIKKYQLNFFIEDSSIDFYDKVINVIFDKPYYTKEDRIKLKESELNKYIAKFNSKQQEILRLYIEEYITGNINNLRTIKNFDYSKSLKKLTNGMIYANQDFDEKLKSILIDITKMIYDFV